MQQKEQIKKLSASLTRIEEKAVKLIKNYFKGKKGYKIVITPDQHLRVQTGMSNLEVLQIYSDASVVGHNYTTQRTAIYSPQELSVGALLTILDELNRMYETKTIEFIG